MFIYHGGENILQACSQGQENAEPMNKLGRILITESSLAYVFALQLASRANTLISLVSESGKKNSKDKATNS